MCWLNDSGGYEIRNTYYKGCIKAKDITTIPNASNAELNVFEGMFDYLSAIQINGAVTNKTIILNSLANLSRIKNVLPSYNKVNVFFDNDPAGRIATTELQGEYGNIVTDYSRIYNGYKDYNEYLKQY